MSPIPLGILAAQGGFSYTPVLAYDLISTTVASSNVASLTVSNLAALGATYKHLQFRITPRSVRAASTDDLRLRINGLTSNYSRTWVNTVGAPAGNYSTGLSGVTAGPIAAANAPVANWSSAIVTISDFAKANKVKNIYFETHTHFNDGGWQWLHRYGSGMHETDLTAITSFTILADLANLATGTTISLYGIRG